MYKYKYLYKYPSFYPEEHRDRRYFTSQAPPIKEGKPVEPVRVNSFWEHVDKNGVGYGDFFFLYTGERMPYVGDLWINRISAIMIAPRTRIELFTGRNYSLKYDDYTIVSHVIVNNSSVAYPWKDLTKTWLTAQFPPGRIIGNWKGVTSSIKTSAI
jgi:hypothetical protein